MNRVLILTAIFPLSVLASEGNRVGNGGDALVCRAPDKGLSTVELFDFFEASVLRPEKPEARSPVDIAVEKVETLKAVHPELADLLTRRLKVMLDDTDFKDNVALVDIQDSQHIVTPLKEGCRLEQIAMHWVGSVTIGKRFVIDRALWEKLSSFDKAGLMAHEVIYEYFSKLGEEDSRRARAFNAKLFKGEFAKMSKSEYWAWVKSMALPLYPKL